MKIKSTFIRHDSDGETMLIPTGNESFSGIVRGNKTMGAIMDLLAEDTTEDDVVAAMTERFEAPEDTIRADVHKVIESLRQVGALDD